MELSSQQRVLMQSNSLNRYIQSIPSRLEATKQNQQTAVESKYYHLISSVKPIHQLVYKYKQKVDSFVEDLESKHRIKELTREIQLYSLRAKQMEELDKQLDEQVERQKTIEEERKEAVREIRERLNALKLQNATIAYEIELENNRILAESKKPSIKIQRTKLAPVQSTQEKHVRLLQQQQFHLQKQLFSQVHQKVSLNKLILDGFKQIRTSLKKSQKKCHAHGLVGSMIFKLALPEKENRPHPQFKMNNDFRSLVYNTLKEKYKSTMKKEKEQSIEVDNKRFLQFNQLQTVGVLQLKPQSFNILNYVVELRIKQILLCYENSN